MRTEDGSIIYKCLNGDREAFAILIDKYKAGIYAYVCAKLKNMDDAEDVTQEVFIRAYRDLHKLRRWDSFAYWLYAIATYQCRNWLRAKSRRPDHEFIEDQEPKKLEKILADPAIESYQEKQLDESLHEALNSLPEIYREVLMLYYMSGMNSEQIALVLAKSPENIRQRLSRARMLLKEEVISMMPISLPQHKLQASFTFRMVEAIKRIKTHPFSQSQGIPWGLALMTGIIFTVLSLNPSITRIFDIGIPPNSSLPAESQVLKVGDIPVSVLKVSDKAILAGNANNVKLKQFDAQNAFFMAPQADGGKWTRKADMTTARYGMSAAVLDENIYVIGGYNNGFLNTVEMYDSIHDKWETKASLSQGNLGVGSTTANGKIYAIGGWNSNGQYLDTMAEYDPLKDTWTRKANMPTARAWVSATLVDGIIYAIGGMDSTGNFSSLVETYDPMADQWNSKASLPVACECWTTVVRHKIYAMGLAANIGCADICPRSDVYEYDSTLNTWVKKSDMPTTRYAVALIAINNKIYAVGGVSSFNPYRIVSTVEIYDPKTDTWEKGIDLPNAIGYHTGAVADGRIYIIGGADEWANPNVPPNLLSSTVEVLDIGLSASPQGKLPNTWGKIKTK
jgi:RNA polymerase sigma factor (sigma-70 family)